MKTTWTPTKTRLPTIELEAYRIEKADYYWDWYELEAYEIMQEFVVTTTDMTGTKSTCALFDGEDFINDCGTVLDVIAWAMMPAKYEE